MHLSRAKIARIRILVIVVAIGYFPCYLFAQSDQTNANIKVYAEYLSKISDDIIKGYGYVDVYYKDIRLRADSIVLNKKTGQIDAKGHVILDEKNNRFVSDRLLFNFKSSSGKAYNGFGFIYPSFYFEGEEINLLKKDKVRIKNGIYTTCQPPSNAWKMRASDTLIHMNNYVYLKNPSFWVQGVPVFYLPYMVFPIKRERASGFLFPTFGSSNKHGVYVKNAYFWAIAENQDATFYADLFSKKGIGKGLEYRYILGDGKKGILKAYHIRENTKMHVGYAHRDRGRFKLEGEHIIDNDYRLLSNINLVSDNYYFEDYGEDTIEKTMPKVDSHLSLTVTKNTYVARILLEHDRGLYREKTDVLRRYPNISFVAPIHRLFDSPVYYEIEAQYDKFKRDETGNDAKFYRIHFSPKLLSPISLPGGFVLTPSVALDETYYSKQLLTGSNFTRDMYEINIGLDMPRLESRYNLDGFFGLKAVKCVIDPHVSYTFKDGFANDDMNTPTFRFDWLDNKERSNMLKYSVTTHFIGMNKSSVVKELGRLKLSQYYDIDMQRKSAEDVDKFHPRRPFSNIRMELDLFPFDFLMLSMDSEYNVYTDRVEFARLDATGNYGNLVSAYLSWWYKDLDLPDYKPEDFVSGGVSFTVKPITVTFNTRYNLEEASSLENSLEVLYKSQCWGAGIKISSLPGGESEVKFQFKLLGFGGVNEKIGTM